MVKQTALMDLPEEIFENVLRKLTGHDTETFIALRCSSKRLGFLVDKVLVTPGLPLYTKSLLRFCWAQQMLPLVTFSSYICCSISVCSPGGTCTPHE